MDDLSLFDRVMGAVGREPEETRAVSQFNSLKVHDTPHIWGMAFDKVRNDPELGGGAHILADAIGEIISSGRKLIDIVSLGTPDGHFKEAITAALQKAILATKGDIVIRFLFGYVPLFGEVLEYRKYLLENVIRPLGDCPAPTMYFAQLASLVPKYQQWNHCKIIAADGTNAISGGHNLWWTQYATYTPAHDLSIQVNGQAALDAQYFIEYLWTAEAVGVNSGALDRYRTLTPKSTCAKANWEMKPAYGGKAASGIDALKAPKNEQCRARMMAIGRSYMTPATSRASDFAKSTIILNAKKSLKISQQDMVFNHFDESEHIICSCIAKSLLNNKDLVVQIAVSPIHAWAGPQYFTQGGASYSWGAGATGTMQMIVRFIDELEKDGTRRHAAYDRLFVAPFCFTEAEFDSEREYDWPGTREIADPYPTGINTKPSPANHAKFYMADDEVCYVGSDNLYPNSNPEFGYLIEAGDEALETLKTSYWDKVWKYSSKHVVTPSKWFYVKTSCGDSMNAWLGWNNAGYVVFHQDRGDDPTKMSGVSYFGFQQQGNDLYLRAPAYNDHGSASMGGTGDDGKDATWWRGETSGYKVRLGPDNTLVDEHGRYLTLKGGWSGSTWYGVWEKEITQFTVMLDFAVPAV
jgi:murine toxin